MPKRRTAPLGSTTEPGFRSRLMSRVRQRDTAPEMAVRRALTALGYRYRLQRRDLPGSPDLVFSRRRKVIFVHGCFWHAHPGCRHATVPKSRTEYWQDKLRANRERDVRVELELRRGGWDVSIVWECQTRHPEDLTRRLSHFLERKVDGKEEAGDHGESVEREHGSV